ncbi:MAG TPA: hypothetical protein VD864_09730 [Nocardioides sp.]|nr:hypothetical protein [Nocardioides sp.]
MAHDEQAGWLLEGDPAIRWQVLRDLLHAKPEVVTAERERVAAEGWGAALLAEQDDEGTWGGALYSPKWTSTTYTLLLLRRLGLERGHSRALAGCRVLWDRAAVWDGGLTLAKSIREPETCITAMLVLLAEDFGLDEPRVAPTVAWLLGQQLDDGGWNCESVRSGSTRGSFHTTISVLEALDAHARGSGEVPVADALAAGREYLLERALFRSRRTGEVVDPAYLRFPFPPQWHYDVLRGLEHLVAAGAPPDARAEEAVELVRAARGADRRWRRHQPWPGRYWFPLEPAGPSRWATLRALRVLSWWDGT